MGYGVEVAMSTHFIHLSMLSIKAIVIRVMSQIRGPLSRVAAAAVVFDFSKPTRELADSECAANWTRTVHNHRA
jgi:hypothetical protein